MLRPKCLHCLAYWPFIKDTISQFQVLKRNQIACGPGECVCRKVFRAEWEGDPFCCYRPPPEERIPDEYPVENGDVPEAVSLYYSSSRSCLATCNSNDGIQGYCCSDDERVTTPPPTSPTTTTKSSSGSSCFPSTAKIYLQSGKSVTMSELEVEDQVLAGKNSPVRAEVV